MRLRGDLWYTYHRSLPTIFKDKPWDVTGNSSLWYSEFKVDWKRGVVENKWSIHPLDKWNNFIPRVYSIELCVGQIHEGFLRQRSHSTASQSLITALIKQHGGLKHYNWIPSLTLFRSLWWYPPKSDSMTSSRPPLAQTRPPTDSQMHLYNLYYTASHNVVWLQVNIDKSVTVTFYREIHIQVSILFMVHFIVTP